MNRTKPTTKKATPAAKKTAKAHAGAARHAANAAPATGTVPAAAVTVIARVPMTVRWGDLDAFNHVNNAAFLVYAQEARLAWLAGVPGTWFDEHAMPVAAAATMNYRRQLTWPARIVVELSVGRIGTSSVTITHRIVDANDPQHVYADGEVVMVWINPASGRPVPLPQAIRDACGVATG
jgi:acyl-CoA thioester hydrolase